MRLFAATVSVRKSRQQPKPTVAALTRRQIVQQKYVSGVELHRHGPAPVRQRETREVLRRDLKVAGLAARLVRHDPLAEFPRQHPEAAVLHASVNKGHPRRDDEGLVAVCHCVARVLQCARQ